MPSTSSRKGKGRAAPLKPTASLPLGKQLAHTDKQVRDQAIANLVLFVSRGAQSDPELENGDPDDGSSKDGYTPLSTAEMDKLWKGLFYCFWMSDKPLIQQALARDLAELQLLIRPEDDEVRLEAALEFLGGFWRCISREWSGIDRYRMDKFYLLIRRYVNASLRLMARDGWSSEAVTGVNDLLMNESGPLTYKNKSIPTSLSMHLADVYLDELDNVLFQAESTSQSPCPLLDVLSPFISLLAHTTSQIVFDRLIRSLFLPLIEALRFSADSDDERPAKRKKDDAQSSQTYGHIAENCTLRKGGKKVDADELKKGVLQALFEAASKTDAGETNRRKVYKFWREHGGDDE